MKPTWSRVLTTHNGFVVMDVAAPAPAAAIMFAPIVSCPLLSTAFTAQKNPYGKDRWFPIVFIITF